MEAKKDTLGDKDVPEKQPEQDYSFFSLINMFAKVIIFSLESFDDKKEKPKK